MRTVSGLVSIAADARTHQRRARLAWARSRCRPRGSSSSRMCAVPARQPMPEPLRNLTRTRGFAAMFRTQLAPCPRWATSQKVSPSRPSQTGVRQGCPVRGLQAAGGGGAASTARASSAARPLPTIGLSQAWSRAASVPPARWSGTVPGVMLALRAHPRRVRSSQQAADRGAGDQRHADQHRWRAMPAGAAGQDRIADIGKERRPHVTAAPLPRRGQQDAGQPTGR